MQDVKRKGPGASLESDRKFLFIGGCPRSGTSAMTMLLNRDRRLALGLERYKKIRNSVEEFHFREEIFFNPLKSEADGWPPHLYCRLLARWHDPDLQYVGDKAPFYTQCLDRLGRAFSNVRFIALYRDAFRVADSYNARAADSNDSWPEQNDYRVAIDHWNTALQALKDFAPAENGLLYLAPYERLFAGERLCLETLYRFLGMSITPEVEQAFEESTLGWEERSRRPLRLTEEMSAEVSQRLDAGLKAWAEERISEQMA